MGTDSSLTLRQQVIAALQQGHTVQALAYLSDDYGDVSGWHASTLRCNTRGEVVAQIGVGHGAIIWHPSTEMIMDADCFCDFTIVRNPSIP